jgi:MFS family permease
MMITSPLSARIVERIGTKITVALGLGLVTTGLLTMTQLQADTPYGNIFWRLMLMAAGMGLTMAPATDSVMGSLPLFKAGVGSAVNDTTRQVGGALGVAVVGSVLATTYGNQIGTALAENGIVGPAADAMKNSIGAVSTLAPQLQDVANSAFVSAVHWGVAVASIATAVGVIVALLFLPARPRPEDREEQSAEYAEEHTGEFEVPTARTTSYPGTGTLTPAPEA